MSIGSVHPHTAVIVRNVRGEIAIYNLGKASTSISQYIDNNVIDVQSTGRPNAIRMYENDEKMRDAIEGMDPFEVVRYLTGLDIERDQHRG